MNGKSATIKRTGLKFSEQDVEKAVESRNVRMVDGNPCDKDIISLKDCAKKLNLDKSTARRALKKFGVKAGKMYSREAQGQTISVFLVRDIERFIASRNEIQW
jgi:hypothetical protein